MAAKKDTTRYIVTARFMDADEYAPQGQKQTYEIDADVSHFDEDRLKALKKSGNVKEVSSSSDKD